MLRPVCSQLRTQLQEIKEIKTDFDLELPKIKDTRDTSLALSLEEEMREKLEKIREDLRDFFLERQMKEAKQTLERQMKEAEQVMGKDFLGPEAIEVAFGIEAEAKDIPPIPFSKVELERAKELGQFLVLRIDKTPDGQPLTMKAMNELKGGKTRDGKNILERNEKKTGKLRSDAWYQDKDLYATDTPFVSWALVSKEVIPNSLKKDYLEQVEVIANYLTTEVFKDQVISEEYQEAINEFMQAKDRIKLLMSTNQKLAVKELGQLKINQFFYQNPSEVIYDMILIKDKNDERFLYNTYTWTSCQNSDDELVFVGLTDRGPGAYVWSFDPARVDVGLGVCFSRRG